MPAANEMDKVQHREVKRVLHLLAAPAGHLGADPIERVALLPKLTKPRVFHPSSGDFRGCSQ
jgi:hypothetical protein